MKLISWNVNGLRACMNKGFLDFLKESSPDMICLQETKMQREQANFDFEGYHEYWNSALRKGYSGTAIFSKTEPQGVTYGMNIPEHDDEGRVITAQYSDFYLVDVYTPNAKRGLERLPYRMEWEDAFREYLGSLKKEKPVIVCGDMNVAHQPIDIKNSKSNIGNAGYTYEERGKMTELLSSGFVDSFRYLYPEKRVLIPGGAIWGMPGLTTPAGALTISLFQKGLKRGLRTASFYRRSPAATTVRLEFC